MLSDKAKHFATNVLQKIRIYQRLYSLELTNSRGDTRAQRRHARHERAVEGWVSSRPGDWITDYGSEKDDRQEYRAALAHLEAEGAIEIDYDGRNRPQWLRLTELGTEASDELVAEAGYILPTSHTQLCRFDETNSEEARAKRLQEGYEPPKPKPVKRGSDKQQQLQSQLERSQRSLQNYQEWLANHDPQFQESRKLLARHIEEVEQDITKLEAELASLPKEDAQA